MNTKLIKVLIVDDSFLALEILKRVIETDPDLQIVGMAKNGQEALALIPKLKPDLVCLDYYMPGLNGVPLVRNILSVYPVPILIISGILNDKDCREIFDVLQAGALDFTPKPPTYDPKAPSARKLIEKIKVLANVFVMKQYHLSSPPSGNLSDLIIKTPMKQNYEIVVIGASTGGPTALSTIFKTIQKPFPVPILCVQHMSKGFLQSFIDWLSSQSCLSFEIMKENTPLKPGVVYLPQEGKHLEINEQKKLISSSKRTDELHCPSINVTMESVAQQYKNKALGILLTGMGDDGAQGMLKLHQNGGMTVAQSEESCIVYGMPKEAVELHAVNIILNLNEIGPYLLKTFRLM